MKTLISLWGGAFVITELGGQFRVSIDKSIAVGGGEAAGILALEGQASAVFEGKEALDLVAAFVEHHSPAAIVPLEEAAVAVVDSALAAE